MEREPTRMRSAFEALIPIPAEQWEEIERLARVVDVPRGRILLRQGEAVDWLGFLERGLLRAFSRSRYGVHE